jgi:hypothetical protein
MFDEPSQHSIEGVDSLEQYCTDGTGSHKLLLRIGEKVLQTLDDSTDRISVTVAKVG